MGRRIFWGASALAVGIGFISLLLWDPLPHTSRSFDLARNGLWLGHQWYTGRSVRDDTPVSEAALAALVDTLERNGIRHAFLHVGPVRADGTIADAADPILSRLLDATPDVVFLAWLGARVESVDLADAEFQATLLDAIERLLGEGFAGVHFDFEPLPDGDTGYLTLLEALRARFGSSLFVSQATPRAGPFGHSFGPLRGSFWSRDYYRATMRATDQTVVMAYDTGLDFTKGYVAFVRHQAQRLLEWGCATPGHEVLIGVPSYEDVPIYSDPQVENLRTASLGVRSALEARGEAPACFAGLAVYANWVTDPAEWAQFERYWIAPGGRP